MVKRREGFKKAQTSYCQKILQNVNNLLRVRPQIGKLGRDQGARKI